MRRLRLTMLAGSLALAALPLQAQDGFGAAVAVTNDDEVLVLKPGFGRGPASLLVFERTEGRWTPTGTLWSEGSTRGESFGASLALLGDGVLVASGDPGLRYGAWAFARAARGWTAAAPLALDRTAAAGGGAVSLATVMSILQPPARGVAADGNRALVATAGGEGGPAVRVFDRSANGTWRLSQTLEPEGLEPNAGWGSALALRGGRALVGAPGQGRGGAVFIFERGEEGNWRQAAVLDDPHGGSGGLGSSLAFLSGDEAAVGAPRAEQSRGAVVGFVRSGEGTWSRAWTLEPMGGEDVRGFGGALAARGDELWVGAPGSDEGAGRAYGYVRPRPESAWEATEVFAPDDLERRDRFGSAIGLGPGVGVIGSPGVAGGAGAAFAYEREGDGWSAPTRLRAAGELEPIAGAEVRCEEDEAAGFDCRAVDLQAYLPLPALGAEPGERVSDAWGWTDPRTGREYALVGRTAGAALLDITDPSAPRYLGLVPANRSGARDLKVYDDHLFFTGDGAGAHGLVIFDLTRLRDVTAAPRTFEPDAVWDGIGSAHNLIIDTESGFAFTVSTSGGGETCGGGLVMIDIREPRAPSFAGCYTDSEGLIFPGRTHDAQCAVYRGPDEDYRGRQLCFASNETALRIVDVTDKSDPVPISAAAYPGVAYIHQGWLTEDQRYFYLNDELDELVGTTDRTRTLIWDVSDLDDPVVVGEHYGPNRSTDHNLYVKGDRMYQANYQAGLRVIDIADPENPREVGWFDTTPYGADPPGFNGAWTAFPFFESGTVIVTSMLEGVFLLKPRREELMP